jgi:hypothetical protein
MATLEEQVMAQMKDAMKSKDEASLRGLRAIKAEIIKAKTDPGAGGSITAEVELKLLQKLVKSRKDSLTIYQEQNRPDLAQKEIEEEAIAFVKASREPRVEFVERKTAMQEQFPFYGSEAYRARAPAHKGGHPSSVQLGPEETKRPEAPPALVTAGGEFNIQPNTAIYENGWYGSDPVVSEFTTRLRFKTGGPSSATALSGVELSVSLLFSRLVKRCLDAKLDLGAFVSALETHSTEEEGGEKFVLAKKMRALAHAVRLPLPDGDLEATIMLCGKGEGEGVKVNLHALTGHIMSVNV